jgi:hypothetical protein
MNRGEVRADLVYIRDWHALAPDHHSVEGADARLGAQSEWLLAAPRNVGDLEIANIAVVGLFSRGKSTLFNRLVGKAVSPVSQLPETALIIEAQTGAVCAWGETIDGRHTDLDPSPDRFAQSVARISGFRFVRARVCGEFRLPHGIRLTDTPGIGSADSVGEQAWENVDADAMLVVLSSPPGHSRSDVELIRDVERRFAGRFAVVLQAIDDSVNHESLLVLAKQVERNSGVKPLVVPHNDPRQTWALDPDWVEIEGTVDGLASHAVEARYRRVSGKIDRWCQGVALASRRPEELVKLQAASLSATSANSSALQRAIEAARREAERASEELKRKEAAAHFERAQRDLDALRQFHFIRMRNLSSESTAELDRALEQTIDEIRRYRWNADWYPELVRIRGTVTAANSTELRGVLDEAVSRARRDRDSRLADDRHRTAEHAARQLETWRALKVISFILWFVAVVVLLAGNADGAAASVFLWLGSFVLWLVAKSKISRLERSGE